MLVFNSYDDFKIQQKRTDSNTNVDEGWKSSHAETCSNLIRLVLVMMFPVEGPKQKAMESHYHTIIGNIFLELGYEHSRCQLYQHNRQTWEKENKVSV